MTDHQPPPAVEAIGRLEELARGVPSGADWRLITKTDDAKKIGPYVVAADGLGAVASVPNAAPRSCYPLPYMAYIAAANPQAILSLIESLRHSVEREAGLAIELAKERRRVGVRDAKINAMRAAYNRLLADTDPGNPARAALDRRAGT